MKTKVLVTGFEPFTTGQGLRLTENPTGPLAHDIAQRLDGVGLWSPILYPGDVFLLHSYTVHRTNIREDMTGSRRDFELRFARRSVLESRTDINQRAIDFA